MHRNLESTSELTEFAPLSPEDKSSFGLLGFSKFFKLGRGSETAEPDKEKANGNNKAENEWQTSGEPSESDSNANLQYSLAISEGRSLPNVLKRISNLVALKNVGLTSYKNTDLKQYWMPDSFSKECYECGEKFTTFRRRHHCRVCGQIFCSGCCNQEIPGKIMGCTGDLRVCTYCCKVVLSYLQSADIGADLSADLRALQEDLQIKFGSSNVKNADNFQTGNVSSSALSEKGETSTNIRRKPSVGYQEEKFVMGHSQSPSYLSEEERCRALQNSASLRNLYEEILRRPDGISLQSHRYRLRSFPNCFFGNELVDWLISRSKAGTRVQGVAMGQALLEAGYLQAVGEFNFVDGLSLYRPVSLVTPSNSEASSSSDGQEPLWVKQIPQQDSNVTPSSESSSDKFLEIEEENLQKSNSNYFLNINVKDHIVHVSRPSPPLQDGFQSMEKTSLNQGKHVEPSQEKVIPPKETTDIMMNTNWDKTSTFEPQIDKEDPCHQNLSSAFEHHKQSLLRQMLNTEGLSQSWTDTVQKVVSDVVDLVRPDMKNDKEEMDIRLYVQIKKLPGGQKSDSNIVPGIVCSKHIAHRSMRSVIANPRILLLRCSVAYERIEGRLLTLEPVIMQEHEYLKHVVARIASLQPDIVMVYRNVSRLAQEYLLKLGITLVINTKLSILERVSRFTQADIVTSIDAHISKPQLGTCKSFYLKTYQIENGGSKTLMFFEGSSNPSLGCSLILRGGTASELKKLKRIVHFMIFACYNWKLEESYLMDEFAKPPTTPFLLLEDSPDQDSGSVFPENKIEAKVKVDKEDKKVMVETVSDCSDPLQSYLNHTDDVAPKPLEASPVEQLSVAELPFTNKFRKSLDDTILSVSLYIKFSVPYLETEAGRNCTLRRYFPEDIFYSKHFLEKSELNRCGSSVEHPESNSLDCQLKGVKLLPKHPFVLAKMTETVNSVEVQSLLALFRANGGRIPLIQENSQNHTKKETPTKKEEMLDVLDPINHQRLPVLFCSYSSTSQNFPAFCVDPWVVNMYFYGMNDIPLGSFLERYCFRSSYVCPSETCSTPMLEHVRRFVHDPGCINLTLSRLEEFESKQIVMWSWCPKCQTATPMVPMSSNTWSMSFAKFLELRFRGHVYTRRDNDLCRHSLHHDHFQYFGMNKIIALFKFSTITIWEICLPPPVINVQFEMTPQNIIMDELRNLAIKGHEIYSSVLERLHNLEGNEEDIQLMKLQQQRDHGHFKAKIEEIQLKLTSPASENKKSEGGKTADKEAEALLWWIEDSMVYLKRLISEAVLGWNARLQDALNAAKKKDDKEKEKMKKSSEHHGQSSQISVQLDGVDMEDKDEDFGDEIVLDTTNSPFRQLSDSMTESVEDSDDNLSSKYSTSDTCDHDKVPEDQKEKKPHPETVANCDEYQTDSKHNKKSVTNILSHILTSSKDFVLMPNPWSSQEHYLLPLGPNAYIMVHENEPSSIISYALASYDYQRSFEEITHRKLLSSSSEGPTPSPISRRKTLSFSSNSERESEGPESRRSTVLSFLRGNQSSGSLNVAKGNSADGPHTLNSSGASDNGNLNPLDQDEKSEEGVKRGSKTSPSAHIEISFSDSTTTFYCRVYFAEQFAALRQTVFPIGEEAFVRSLSRCVQWAARGGKSGSTFCKTKDDRFVLKEMSKLELQLFLEFANHYFFYIQKCHESNQPTLLGKIVGVYAVSFRNTSNNSALKCNLLVMENLFYKKNVTQKYDLKGSIRNRLVNPSLQNEGEIVYLDENLLQMTTDSPLYILSHSQAILMKAIESDTQFLASQTVMDYSLLVGLDEDRRELVVGIIDYIRTFTWDKKLETMVKKTVIMGGQGKQPTVIQPKDYRERFIAAMHRYFLPVPDRWSGLGKTEEL